MNNSKNNKETHALSKHALKNLQNYKGTSTLKKEAMNVLVKMLNAKEVESLRKVFYNIDKDQTGFINVSELGQVMKDAGFTMSGEEMKETIKNVDYEGNGMINYSEFIAATISTH
jgi:calcium-dependent protein kinase